MGNTFLPKAGTSREFTVEHAKEWVRCSKDPVYFLKKYVKIIHLDRGEVPFDMYEYQEDLAKAITRGEKRIVMNTARQAGKTSSVAGMVLHYIIFNMSKTVAVLAQKLDQSQEIMGRIQRMFESLPEFLKPGVKTWNKRSFELENGNIVFCSATGGSAVRGRSISLLIVDETAHVPNWEDFAASVLPTVSSSKESVIVFLSTPLGLNHFYYYVEGARKKTNGFYLIEAPWWKVPGRDEAWKQRTLAELNYDEERFQTEFCCEFVGSSGTLIAGSVLKHMAANAVNPIFTSHEGLKQYERPIKDHAYALVADVSEGKGMDYSAFHVIDITALPYKQVATFRNNMLTPSDYAIIINTVGSAYNKAFVLVENNNMGGQVCHILHNDYEYENIIKTENRGAAGKQITFGGGKTAERGIRTSVQVKALGCSVLKLLVEQKHLLIYSADTISELSTFSRKGKSYEAEEGKNDDLVMGLVIFSWMTQTKSFKALVNMDILEAMKEMSSTSLEDLKKSIGFIRQDGTDVSEGPKYERYGGELWEVVEDNGSWTGW